MFKVIYTKDGVEETYEAEVLFKAELFISYLPIGTPFVLKDDEGGDILESD